MKNADLQINVSASAISQKRYDAFGDAANTLTFYGSWTGPKNMLVLKASAMTQTVGRCRWGSALVRLVLQSRSR